MHWSHRWLSRGGKLVLIKSVLEALPVFWMHFWIPVGIIEKIRKLCFKFLWSCGDGWDLFWFAMDFMEGFGKSKIFGWLGFKSSCSICKSFGN